MADHIPHRYCSATEYQFREEQVDAIVQTANYHGQDYRSFVIWFLPHEHADVRPSISAPFRWASNTGLGSLDRLPLELLHDVFFRLDMHSLFKFRQTNLGSRQAVDSLKPYEMVVSHGLDFFCALLRTRLALDVSLFDFYHVLCTQACAVCGEFGGIISLLNWKRCCFLCLEEAPELRVHIISTARRQSDLTKAELDQLRSIKAVPDMYLMKRFVHNVSIMVMSAPQPASTSYQQPRAPAQVQWGGPRQKKGFSFMGSCALPYYDSRTGKVEHGMSCAGCQRGLEKDIIGSRGGSWAFEARYKTYTQDGFLEHFRWCEQAQLLWRSSGEGSYQPSELPEAARGRD